MGEKLRSSEEREQDDLYKQAEEFLANPPKN